MKFLKQLLAVSVLLFSAQVLAAAQLGKDYKELSPSQPVHSGEKIEVLEFFFYECPHCYHLHGPLSAWEKKMPKDVELQFIPVIFRDSLEPMARTYYALEALGQNKRLHNDLFEAWHVYNTDLSDESKVLDFVAQRGVDRAKFSAAFNSFSMSSKVARSNQMVRDYGIRGTPTLVVDGKYAVTGLTPEDTIRVLNELIVKARKERSKR
ncbi:MAG: thiol:disulfide interchange protein DsbA/DsbL [Gallionellaceae bacterium]|nr:MAG: thiol:disulfide interchange protein DsbA/DsbL [Gallionellaceae bacterium]